MSKRRPREAFLSHASADRRLANAISQTLSAHGVRHWYSSTSIQGAQQWHDEIGAALARCDWFVLLLTRPATGSRWVKQELLFALNDAHYENRIVPVLAEPCDWRSLSWTLGALQMIGLRPDFEAGCRDLLRVWGIALDPNKLARPARKPEAPRAPRAAPHRRTKKP